MIPAVCHCDSSFYYVTPEKLGSQGQVKNHYDRSGCCRRTLLLHEQKPDCAGEHETTEDVDGHPTST